MNNTVKIIIITVIAVGVGFFGGMKYGQSSSASAATSARVAFAGRGGTRGGAAGAGALGAGGGFVSGQILSADSQSITVSMATGGSKIIFLSASTTVMKATNGSVSDLTPGTTVTATGSTNSDGSITAQSIQIRPAGMATPRTQTGQ